MRRRDFVLRLAVIPIVVMGRCVLAAEKVFRVGYLDPASRSSISEGNLAEFRKALIALGYEEGKNVFIDVRWANGDGKLYKSLCGEFVAERVDVLVTHSTWGASIAKREVSTTPIVVALVQDAVGNGLVHSLAQPQGNITGSSFFFPELVVKRLELAKEAFPGASRAGVLLFPDDPAANITADALKAAGQHLGIDVARFDARGPEDFQKAASDMIAAGVNVALVPEQPIFGTHAKAVAYAMAAHSLPSVGFAAYASLHGGMLGYGPRISALFRRAAWYVDKILQGTQPRDLPVQQPTEFLLTVNQTLANSMHVEIPPIILARADEVI
jgi:putative ABC transport system substrate-binding protein